MIGYQLNYGVSSFVQLKFVEALEKSEKLDTHTFVKTVNVKSTKTFFTDIIKKFTKEKSGTLLSSKCIYTQDSNVYDMYAVWSNLFIRGTGDSSTIVLQIGSTPDNVEYIDELIESLEITKDENKYADWYFYQDGSMNSIKIKIKAAKSCTSNHVPWVPGNVKDFCDNYINSKESILIMLGPPGTGKTSLINYIIDTYNREAMITYDSQIMNKDNFYIKFITNSSLNMLILEDADAILEKSKTRPEILSKILNVGDGLVDISNKKIIITANLDSKDDIDPAIARKGRCFDIVTSRPLVNKEIINLAKAESFDLNKYEDLNDLTLAEFYNGENAIKYEQKGKFGFRR